MKRIFEQESPPILEVFDDGQKIRVEIRQLVSVFNDYRLKPHPPIRVPVTKKVRRFLLILRFFLWVLLVSVLFLVGVFVAVGFEISEPLHLGLLALGGLATFVAINLIFRGKFTVLYRFLGNKTFVDIMEFDRSTQSITPSVEDGVSLVKEDRVMRFHPFDAGLGNNPEKMVPIDETSVFTVDDHYVSYRYGLRQSQRSLGFSKFQPLPMSKRAAAKGTHGFVNLNERVVAVLNEVLVLVRENPVTKPEPEIKTKPATKRAKAAKPEPIIEDDAPFNPMD